MSCARGKSKTWQELFAAEGVDRFLRDKARRRGFRRSVREAFDRVVALDRDQAAAQVSKSAFIGVTPRSRRHDPGASVGLLKETRLRLVAIRVLRRRRPPVPPQTPPAPHRSPSHMVRSPRLTWAELGQVFAALEPMRYRHVGPCCTAASPRRPLSHSSDPPRPFPQAERRCSRDGAENRLQMNVEAIEGTFRCRLLSPLLVCRNVECPRQASRGRDHGRPTPRDAGKVYT